ncbi:MAG TPA: ABATE domain-containing protein [Syntrophales bacterium]|nr:ABATE domain-containing protein [Syntrophales bacterium]
MAQRNSHPKYGRFRFDAGSLSLNFVATMRHRGSPPRELLTGPEAFAEWLQIVGLTPLPPAIAYRDYEDAILLREAIHDTVRSLIMNKKPNAEDVDLINRTARFSIAIPQLHAGAAMIKWETANPVRAALAVIARDAITLIADTDRGRLKKCDSRSCQMLFVDSSPGNRRRWCAMSICGNRQKVAMHRQNKISDHGSTMH